MTTVDEHELRHHARQLRDAYLELHQLKGLHPPRPEARVMRATPGPRDPGNPIATYTWIHLETNLREIAHNAFREAGIRIHAADNNAPRLCELIAYHAQPISNLDWASDIIDELGEEHRIIHNCCHPDEPITVAQLDESPHAVKTMQANGWQTLPLVEVTAPDGEVMRWADMRKDDIDALAYLVKENA